MVLVCLIPLGIKKAEKEFLESQVVPNIPSPIRLWARHVDDIFVLFPNDSDSIKFIIAVGKKLFY